MGTSWSTATVSDLVASGVLDRPLDGNHGELHPKKQEFVAAGIPFVMASDLKDGRVDVSGCSFITPERASTLRKGFAQTGDVLLSHKGTVGRTAIVQDLSGARIVLTPQVTYYRVLDEARLDRRFLKYYFDSPDFQELFKSWADAGSTRAYLGITAQEKLPIDLPPIAEQIAIAEVLAALDDKIELNREMNQALEATARAIFKSWFADPDESIPTGWSLGKIADVACNPRDVAQPREVSPDTAYIGLEHMPRKSISLSEWEYAEKVSSQKFTFRAGDILFGKLRPYFHKVGVAPIDGVCSTDVLVIRPVAQEWFGFLLGHISSSDFMEYADTGSTGTKMPRTNWEFMARYPAILPPMEVAAKYDLIVRPLIDQLLANIFESLTLAQLRDTLLPNLFSGEIRVRQAEKAVERVL